MNGMLSLEDCGKHFNDILFCFVLFFAILLFILYYHGVFHDVVVKATKPPFNKDLVVVYKFTQNYSTSRTFLTEVQRIAPKLHSFSIYHEDFYTRSQVGSAVGVVLYDQMEESLYRELIFAGYKAAIFPAIDYAVVSSFPYRNQYSLALAVYRTYPKFREYIKVNRLCAHPIMELYWNDKVYFIAPLSKQFDFYAEEAIPKYEDETPSEEEVEDCQDVLECAKCHHHQNALVKHCCCDNFLHSTSCDRRKRAV